MTPACPVCSSTRVEEFLRRDAVPVHQNLVFRDRAAAAAVRRGNLSMNACSSCGFVFNAAFDPSLLAYGADYDNTQDCSPAFGAHLDALAARVVSGRGVRGARIVEVGCGKGGFLRRLVETGPGNTGVGFDPSHQGPESELDGRLRFERRFYDASCANVPADAVVCRHVIEHVADPVALLRAVRGALANSPGAKVFFETPCVDWILRGGVVWDFFYEHCSLFTLASLSTAFETAGFVVEEKRHVFDGQYLWIEARPASAPAPVTKQPGDTPALAKAFSRDEPLTLARWREQAASARGAGKVAVWGAGAKGATFANLIDPRGEAVDCLIDVNPRKRGAFLAGTGHPIVAPEDAAVRGVASAVLMNPNYRAEIEAQLARLGTPLRLL
ncbi:MAG: class I SAM-dependent methyltransferase [Elusimicrobiota bacterium]|nr:class I SAM-dependent methyltransferase [Elusimicrobiota bacterium]